MASGFERLERFFGGPKYRERAQLQPRPIIANGPAFPAPSFMRPTSYHMTPRQENYRAKHVDERGRSQSLPEAKGHGSDGRPTSAASSSTLVEQQAALALAAGRQPQSRSEEAQELEGAPRLSPFRFPEDSLFKNDEFLLRLSGDSSPSKESRRVRFEEPPFSQESVACHAPPTESAAARDQNQTEQQSNSQRHLDVTADLAGSSTQHSPSTRSPAKHISMLFKPIDFGTANGMEFPGKAEHSDKSMILMPSPSIVPSRETALLGVRRNKSAGSPSPSVSPTRRSSNASSNAFPKKFSLFPKQANMPASFPRPAMDSPPPSDGGDDIVLGPIAECPSSASLPTPTTITPRHSGEISDSKAPKYPERRASVRETWGYRVDDPKTDGLAENASLASRSRLRKSVSEASLSLLASAIAKENILKEPTLDDFLALSDDDIAELSPPMPPECPTTAPPPPPKEASVSTVEKSGNASDSIKQTIKTVGASIVNPSSGEVTPPYTPVDAQFVAAVSQPHSIAGELGAIMAAEIAKKYSFDLVYIVSLWPNVAGRQLDPSQRATTCTENTTQTLSSAGPSPTKPDSRITGRFLGAFGLSDFGSPPFPIVTKAHLKALGLSTWKEYRCPPSAKSSESHKAERITRGLVCSFHADSVPVPGLKSDAGMSPRLLPNNRGIVFAGYTKQRNESKFPSGSSTEGQVRLQKLHADAKALVDALIERN